MPADDVPPYVRWRHPPGCPDSDWCSGNGVCYWRCQDDGQDDLARPPGQFLRQLGEVGPPRDDLVP
jgi:hypothetical protein